MMRVIDKVRRLQLASPIMFAGHACHTAHTATRMFVTTRVTVRACKPHAYICTRVLAEAMLLFLMLLIDDMATFFVLPLGSAVPSISRCHVLAPLPLPRYLCVCASKYVQPSNPNIRNPVNPKARVNP